MPELDTIFRKAVDDTASDIHLSPGEPYIMRQYGRLQKIPGDMLTADRCKQLIFELLDEKQKARLLSDLQLDFAYELAGLGRFRGSAMMHRNGLSAVFRVIPPRIPSLP